MTKKLNIAQGCIVDRSVLLQFFLPLKVIFDLFGALEILKHAYMKLGPYYHFFYCGFCQKMELICFLGSGPIGDDDL